MHFLGLDYVIAEGDIQRPAPLAAPQAEISLLKATLAQILQEIQMKTSKMSAHDLRRILLRCASVLLTAPVVS